MNLGAVGFLEKPVTLSNLSEAMDKIKIVLDRTTQKLLLVEPDDKLRKSLAELLQTENLQIEIVTTAKAAIKALDKEEFDCAIIDLNLKDGSGFNLIKEIQGRVSNGHMPLVAFSTGNLTEDQKSQLKELNKTGILKDVDSPERLLNEVGLFLHRVEKTLPENKRKILRSVRQEDNPFSGRKLLIVDDDQRNIVALSSVLQKYDVRILTAENGMEALNKVEKNPDIDLVLMDIMMPEMDGYEAMRRLRAQEKYRNLPVIAVTAKAMKGDRQKCLEAGASDYITKPVDRGQLISLLRVWLYKA